MMRLAVASELLNALWSDGLGASILELTFVLAAFPFHGSAPLLKLALRLNFLSGVLRGDLAAKECFGVCVSEN